MRVVILTGGIGAGKSTAAEFLRSKGAVTIDADRVAEHVLEAGSQTLAQVVETFGEGVLQPDGTLNRAAIAREAFQSLELTRKLNAVVHPAIAREVGPAVADMRLLPNPPDVVVLEVPLLVEAPVFAEIGDVVLAISADEETRMARSVAAGRAEGDARRRLAVQATDAQRARFADVVITNEGSKERFTHELERFWNERLAVG